MKQETREAIAERSRSIEINAAVAKYIDQIDNHLLTGDDEHFWIGSDEEKFDQLIALLGHTTLDGANVIAYDYTYNGRGDAYGQTNESPRFKGEWPMHSMLAKLGDIGMNLEFMNEYRVKLFVKLDDESIVVYEHESHSMAVVCEDCQELEDYGPGGGSEYYSCDHCDDEFSSTYRTALIKTPDEDTLNSYLVHGF
jgi:hypothetical protein